MCKMGHVTLPAVATADSRQVEGAVVSNAGGVEPTQVDRVGVEKDMPLDMSLAECQSPLAQWLGLPVPCTSGAPSTFSMEQMSTAPDSSTQRTSVATQDASSVSPYSWAPEHGVDSSIQTAASATPCPFGLENSTAFATVPVQTELQWAYGCASIADHGRCTTAHPLSESASRAHQNSDAAVEPSVGAGHRISASAARRRRRQRAAAYKDGAVATSAAEAPLIDCVRAGGQISKQVDTLMSQLNAGQQEQNCALQKLRGCVRRLTFDAAGCRLVQLAFEVADKQTAADLASELHGCVRRSIESPHGNYVIQKLVQALPAAMSDFVAAEIRGSAADVARHRFGCRVICRLLEHAGSEQHTLALIEELLRDAENLCYHPFGHHVIEAILERGSDQQKHQIAVALHSNILSNATDRHGSYVFEAALQHCACVDQSLLVSAIVGSPENVIALAEHPTGFHVVRALLAHSADSRRLVQHIVKQAEVRLRANGNGLRILSAL